MEDRCTKRFTVPALSTDASTFCVPLMLGCTISFIGSEALSSTTVAVWIT